MTINETNFLDYLEQQEQQNQHCNHSLYLQWSNGSSAFESNLVPIGQIIQQDITIGSGSYWGFNAPICLSEYPYCECQILQCEKCRHVFFHYVEYGGHGPQKRYRLIRKVLFVEPVQEIILNLGILNNNYTIHNYLAYELKLKELYGKSLDAFWDVCSGLIEMPQKLIIFNWEVFNERNPKEALQLKQIASAFNNLHVDKEIVIIAGHNAFGEWNKQ